MHSGYHAGERAVQAQAGVLDKADRAAAVFVNHVPPVLRDFLQHQRFVVIGSLDERERVWASIRYGDAGFANFNESGELFIEHQPPDPEDPLAQSLQPGAPIGILAIEAQSRRRARMNGCILANENGALRVHLDAIYSNCPKYIQARAIIRADEIRCGGPAIRTVELSPMQQRLIRSADTFFIASYFFEGGADASHRGGNPGFVDAVSERELVWPDYRGNSMFNTLGNILRNPSAGLLFVDWDTGSTLQLTGRAHIDWSDRRDRYAGAERLLRFTIDAVVETPYALPFRWQFESYSKANPPAP